MPLPSVPPPALHSIEQAPRAGEAAATLVMLHGYGASEEDLISLGQALDPRLHSIGLRAPLRLPWGGFAWYPLVQEAGGISADPADVDQAIAVATLAIEAIAKKAGAPPILLGFSQGGGIALSVALQRPELARAVISLSGVPPMVPPARLAPKAALARLPFFAAHGTRDQILPFLYGQTTRAKLEEAGCDLQWHQYSMGHEISDAELRDLRDWLRPLLNP